MVTYFSLYSHKTPNFSITNKVTSGVLSDIFLQLGLLDIPPQIFEVET